MKTSGIERPNPFTASFDFTQSPLLVIWEMTQACGLACSHCRADASLLRHRDELTTLEAKALIDNVKKLGSPVMVLSGGDPLQRQDLDELVEYGAGLGLRMCTIPAVTPRLTRDRMVSLQNAGIAKLAFSLDGSTPALHDGMRNIEGTFERTMNATTIARELGISIQINSLVHASNVDDLEHIAHLVDNIGADMWELMFLIPVGRGVNLPSLGAQECERAFSIIYDIESSIKAAIKVTEAPHYRRYKYQRGYRGPLHRVNAGDGFVFVSHIGDIYPSGFLPEVIGNIRSTSIIEAYREHPLMKKLRAPETFSGACGVCKFNDICGGSRSRAYTMHDDPLGSEPWCLIAQGFSQN